MDAERQASEESRGRILAMRSEWLAQFDELAMHARGQIRGYAAQNRAQKRRALVMLKKVDQMECWFRGRVDQILSRALDEYDPGVGTLKIVQDEVATRMAEIFS